MKQEKPALPRMDEAQFRRVKKLIKSLCANYDDSNCLLLDDGYEPCPCPQLITCSLLCRYFRNAVLPSDKELYAEIMGDTGTHKRCTVCGTLFIPGGNRARYCGHCGKNEQRRHTRERVRRHRGTL